MIYFVVKKKETHFNARKEVMYFFARKVVVYMNVYSLVACTLMFENDRKSAESSLVFIPDTLH